MASKDTLPYGQRAAKHPNPLARKLFEIADRKKTNLVLAADVDTSKELLAMADSFGPYISVLKTHIDFVSDLSPATIEGLNEAAKRHDFLIFEDRKFVDVGSVLQTQYAKGLFKIYDWAHIVSAVVLPGEGTVQALDQVIRKGTTAERGILVLAEMTSKGSLAVGKYTQEAVDIARKYPQSVLGILATKKMSSLAPDAGSQEDLLVFTTGVNDSIKVDGLNQQYQTVATAMDGGSDFLIVGRGIYAAKDPLGAVKEYRKAGWEAYERRVGLASQG